MLEQLKMLRAKGALPRKQALVIQPRKTFFDKGEKRLKRSKNQLTLNIITAVNTGLIFIFGAGLKHANTVY